MKDVPITSARSGAPSQFEAAFLSLAHSPDDLAFAGEQARLAMADLA